MKRKIESYKELLEHRKQLTALLQAKKELINSDIELLKVETKPASDVFGSFSRSGRQRLVAIGLGLAARRLFRKLILMKTPWLLRKVLEQLDENSRLNLKDLMKQFTTRTSSILKENPIKATNEGVAGRNAE